MILKGSQRGGASAMAAHLLNAEDNEHVEVEAINGFMSDTVEEAFQEIQAVSRSTSCTQFLFSLSLSPPGNAVVSNQEFRVAIDEAMKRLGLAGQPHVIIFHEKNQRRHCHLVVSRIDNNSLKAINLSFFKDRLCDLSRELFLTHGWELPQGHVNRMLSNPLNYSLEEHQVAKRAKRDTKAIKSLLKGCWEHSDSKAGFAAALNEQGFQLCRGDRRGFVAIDQEGNIYSLSRWLNVKTRLLQHRLGDPAELSTIERAIEAFEQNSQKSEIFNEQAQPIDPRIGELENQIAALQGKKSNQIKHHRIERTSLRQSQEYRRIQQIGEFQQTGSPLQNLWHWVSGKRHTITAERQAVLDELAEQSELEALELSNSQRITLRQMRAEIATLAKKRDALSPQKKPSLIPQQVVQTIDPDALFHTQQIRKSPDYVLKLITVKKAAFSRNDILRTLAHYLNVPQELKYISERVLGSTELVHLNGGSETNAHFTTRSYQEMEQELFARTKAMAECKSYGVQPQHMLAAIHRQNSALQQSAGANLSDEQCAAIEHALNSRQLCAIVGLAGAGKSTLLSAANHAWSLQGYRVLGAALSGKAADGLEQASSIPSRTLASWEMSWKHERNLLQAGDIMVIDEAGMVGSAQLSRIVKEVHEKGAKLVLAGDPDQLQPINAGAPFRQIADNIGFAELSEIRRQKSNWQKKASIDLARGRTAEAIHAYHDHGAVEFAQTRSNAITALVEDYMVDYEFNGNNNSRLALAHRRDDVFAINQAIRMAMKSADELTDEKIYNTDNGKRAFANGDRLLFTRNDAELGVRNGILGTVESVGKNQLVIQVDGSDGKPARRVSINPNRYNTFDHGYATTIHKSQGATVGNSYILASRSMDQNLTYVAMTRHGHEVRLYAAYEEFADIGKLAVGLGRKAFTKTEKNIGRVFNGSVSLQPIKYSLDSPSPQELQSNKIELGKIRESDRELEH